RLFGEILGERNQIVARERLGDRRHHVVLARAGFEVAKLKEHVAEILPPDDRHRKGLLGRRAIFAVAGGADLRFFFDGLEVGGERTKPNRERNSEKDKASSHTFRSRFRHSKTERSEEPLRGAPE